MPHSTNQRETFPQDTVLIVGGGPVGMVLATTLSRRGIRSVVLERHAQPTKWPKMDLTTARSMEIFRMLGLSSDLRQLGVGSNYSLTCNFSSGLNAEKPITAWPLPSVDDFRAQIRATNDGSMPLEPWQRVSQEIFEDFLRKQCHDDPLVDFRAGWNVTGACETKTGVELTAFDPKAGVETVLEGFYAAACDGANSVVRQDLGIALEGGPLPAKALLIHFKSRDITRLRKQGQFWHTFFPKAASEGGSVKGAIIAQDEIDTWTVHCFLPGDADEKAISSEDAVYSVLGGMGGPFKVDIDEILVRSVWTPSVTIAAKYATSQRRIFLAGDAAHQFPPTGGYGMNSGIADAFDLGWKLAGVLDGWGGEGLLESYEAERRPVAALSLLQAKMHIGNLMHLSATVELSAKTIDATSPEGDAMRKAVHDYVQTHDGHNKSLGVEMGYRYESSILFRSEVDAKSEPPAFDARRYIPSTYPGSRAPHVFLSDRTPVYDKLGSGFTLVSFVSPDAAVQSSLEDFIMTAKKLHVPLTVVNLSDEAHARNVWGADLVLVRPDNFVAWRVDDAHGPAIDAATADRIIRQAIGQGDRATEHA